MRSMIVRGGGGYTTSTYVVTDYVVVVYLESLKYNEVAVLCPQ